MPKIPGADASQQSRTLQSLDRFTPDGITALAAVALVLLDRINSGELVASDQVEPDRAKHTRTLLERLYPVQDALHGSAAPLPAALASFLSVAEGEVRHG